MEKVKVLLFASESAGYARRSIYCVNSARSRRESA